MISSTPLFTSRIIGRRRGPPGSSWGWPGGTLGSRTWAGEGWAVAIYNLVEIFLNILVLNLELLACP